LAGKIKIVQDDFQKATTELQALQDLMEKHKAEMQTKYSDMEADWKGAGGVAFESYAQDIINRFDKNIINFNQLIMTMNKIKEYFIEADEKIVKNTAIPILKKELRP
jgi:uncharacterized protein YukE